MKKKFALLFLSLLCLCACAIGLAACNTANGTYYLINREGKVEMNTYIKLDGKKWEDNEGFSGTYKIEDDKITFYMEVFGESAEWNSGSYKDGIIKISSYLGGKQTFVSENHKHSYGSWEKESEATCTEDGIETRTCACGIKESRSWQQAKGHNWGEWEIITDSTCSVEGSKTHQCSRCSITETETIGIKDHKFEGWDFDETKHFRNCIVGGEYYEEVHIGNNICSVCQYKYGDTIGLKYALNRLKDGYTVIGLGEVNATEIKIPNVYKGLPVTSIGNSAFKNCSSITSVIIPKGVTSIGSSAFEGCSSLTNMPIPDSVTYIDKYAFNDCSKLIQNENGVHYVGKWIVGCGSDVTQVTLHPDTNVVQNVFSECSLLKSITVDENNPHYSSQDGILYDKAKTEFLHIPQALSGDIIIPNGVTSIDSGAFYNRISLTSISIPDSVTSIGGGAFDGCSKLMQTENGIKYVDKWVIDCYTSATQVTLRSDTKGIAYQAFKDCSSLTNITIPDSVKSIDSYAFRGCSSLKNITIGNGVTSIGDDAFRNCFKLETATIPAIACTYIRSDHIKTVVVTSGDSISDEAFRNCTSLTSITIPSSVKSIGNTAFYYCISLTSITIPYSVTSIGSEAFYGCSSLTSVTIPNSITEISSSAFVNCSSLTSITIPDSVKSIGGSAFSGCTSLTSITIPSSVKSIGNTAFYYCTSLTSITIPNSVTSIGSEAFYGCSSLTSVTIPNSVTEINGTAFHGCSSLTSINFGGTIEEWNAITEFNGWLFYTDYYTIYCTDGTIQRTEP